MKLSKNHIALACIWAASTLTAPAFAGEPIAEEVNIQELFVGAKAGPRAREEVREELRQARANGTLTPTHEIGDTQQVLDAREAYAELQREVVTHNRAVLVQRQQAARLPMPEPTR